MKKTNRFTYTKLAVAIFAAGASGRCQPHMDSQFKDNIYFT
jgi:hypothetical protein